MTLAGNDHGSARRLNERRHLIVMFCDVVDSTRLSRRRDVETYYSVLRAYYDACRAVVARHGGFVAQHHGDGIYIWFGYPQPHEDDALRAVRAGLDLLGVLHRVSAEFDGEAGEPFQVRIAAHAGEVLVAPVEHESGPLAFGHTPNLAAKLQQAARPGTMVISSALLRLVERAVEVTPRPGTVLRDGVVVAAHEVVREHRRPGRIAAEWQTPLVGRDREVDRLQELWSDVRDGPGDIVAIVGDRGVGKTRLASTLTALAAESDATVLDCASNRLDARTAYRTMRVLLAAATGIGPDDQSVVGAARLRDHLQGTLGMDDVDSSVLGASLGLARGAELPSPSVDPRRLAQLTADTLVEWLRRLAARTPTIVAIDDIADADPSSMEILARLAAEPLPHLLIVVTANSATSLPDGLSTAHTRILELSPLSEDDADALVAVVTAVAPLELHVSERIVRQGEGIPLYLEELARTAQEADGTALPITLTGYLQARIAASAADREVVGVLAAAGRAVEEAVLTAVLEVDDAGLRDGLAGLMARDLVVHLTDDGSHYRFRHGLIAEAAYGLLLHGDRTRLHGRLADAMIDRHGRGHRLDWNVVGRHLDLAGRPVEAVDALLNGADEARSAGANHEALQGYQDVLDVLEKIADAGVRDRLEVRCRMRRGAAAIAARGWGADEAIEDFTRSAELCRRLGPRPEYVATMTGVYAYYLIQGELRAARQLAEEVLDWVDTAHDDYRADNGSAFATLCMYEGDYKGALEHLRRSERLFTHQRLHERSEQTWLMPFDTYVVVLAHLATLLWITGSPGVANQAADRAMARAASLPFPQGPFSMAYAKSFLAWTHNLGGHHRTAALLAADVVEIGERHGFTYWESTGAIHLAVAEHGSAGRADAADVITMQAAFKELIRSRVFLPYVLTAAAQVRVETGRLAEAAAGFEAAGRLAEDTGSMFYEAERLRLLAGSGLRPPEESLELLHLCRALAERQGALIFELRAALDIARLDPAPGPVDVLAQVVAKFLPGVGYPELNEARLVLAGSVTRA